MGSPEMTRNHLQRVKKRIDTYSHNPLERRTPRCIADVSRAISEAKYCFWSHRNQLRRDEPHQIPVNPLCKNEVLHVRLGMGRSDIDMDSLSLKLAWPGYETLRSPFIKRDLLVSTVSWKETHYLGGALTLVLDKVDGSSGYFSDDGNPAQVINSYTKLVRASNIQTHPAFLPLHEAPTIDLSCEW